MTSDPASFFRDMMGQWETMTNQFGGAAGRTPDTASASAAATSPAAKVQEATRDAMGKALAVYNMPSREDVADLSGRLEGVEDRLARIETLLTKIARDPPSRTRAPRGKAIETKD